MTGTLLQNTRRSVYIYFNRSCLHYFFSSNVTPQQQEFTADKYDDTLKYTRRQCQEAYTFGILVGYFWYSMYIMALIYINWNKYNMEMYWNMNGWIVDGPTLESSFCPHTILFQTKAQDAPISGCIHHKAPLTDRLSSDQWSQTFFRPRSMVFIIG